MHFLYVPVTTSQNGPPRVAPPEAAVKENAELALTQDSMEADVKDVWIKIINAGLHKCTVSLVCVCVCVCEGIWIDCENGGLLQQVNTLDGFCCKKSFLTDST